MACIDFIDVSFVLTGNPTKPVDIAVKWTNAVIEEWFLQSDEEKKLGLPISYDRSKFQVPRLVIDACCACMWNLACLSAGGEGGILDEHESFIRVFQFFCLLLLFFALETKLVLSTSSCALCTRFAPPSEPRSLSLPLPAPFRFVSPFPFLVPFLLLSRHPPSTATCNLRSAACEMFSRHGPLWYLRSRRRV